MKQWIKPVQVERNSHITAEPSQPLTTHARQSAAAGSSTTAALRLKVPSFLCVLSASSASYRSSKVIHRRRGEPGFASPQTTVSNFGGRQKMGCEKLRLLLNPPIEHAGSGRRILRPNVATFSQRLSLRNPAPCRKGMLRTLRLQAETWQRRTSISLSIRQGPRAQSTNLN